MSSSTSRHDRRRLFAGLTGLISLIALIAAFALPASAFAAPCPVNPGNATSWTGAGGNGSFGDPANWSNGTPSGSCDVTITPAGSPVITMTGGANVRSLVLGGTGSTPQLVISDESPNTNLDAQPAGITIAAGASVKLTCQPGGCPGGGPDIYSGPSPFSNAGTITVDANTGGGAVVGGVITNTGAMSFEKSGALSGQVTNKGSITVADGATATNSGSSCGGTEPFVKNDTGGTISGTGTGALSVINFEQGAGTSEDVVIPCGSLKYTGNGASEVRAFAGFNLTGEMQANQALTVVAASPNTNVFLQSDFTNKGSITLTCPTSPADCSGGSGGGVGFAGNGKQFTNAGTFTVASISGTGANVDSGNGGTITNTGTMSFDQTARLSGIVVNKGKIDIADTKTVTSSGSSCGDTGAAVKNDTGGSINATGTGTLSVLNYEQGNGTTSGALPVQIPCGTLKYTGTGASTVQVNGNGTPMTGNIAAGQTLRLVGGITSAPFANAGTIVFDQAAGNPTVSSSTMTNTGKIELSGASANTSTVNGQIDQTGPAAQLVVPAGTKLQLNNPLLLKAGTLSGSGTIAGSVENTGGVVSPGASPGTLSLSGNYTQGAGGRLDVEIGGTGAGQFDVLAVGGSASLGGTVALIPSGGFLSSAAVGDNVSFLTYGGTATGGFATTTVNPALACPKQMSVSNDSGTKSLKATVVDSGSSCGGGGGGGGNGGNGGSGGNTPPPPPPAPVPNTKLGVHPGSRVTTKQSKLKVKFGFSSDVAGATFQCKLDKGSFKPCKSPKTYKVKPGQHKFSVRAVGPGGTDASSATFKFKVIKQKG